MVTEPGCSTSITFELKGNDGDGDALVYTIDQVTKEEIAVAILISCIMPS
jgi:hypothetical protein